MSSMVERNCACGNENCHIEREMVAIGPFEEGKGAFSCDPCIVEIVTALNNAGMKTVASCCGHGWRPGNIALADGREIIIARSFEEARKIDRVFPVDVNGDSFQVQSPDGAVAWGVRTENGFLWLTDLPAHAERWRKDGHNVEPLFTAALEDK